MKFFASLPNLLFRTVESPRRRSSWLLSLTTICFLCGGLSALQVRAVQQTKQQSQRERTQKSIQNANTLREVKVLRGQIKQEQSARLAMTNQLSHFKAEIRQNYVPKKSALASASQLNELNEQVRQLKRVAALTPVQGAGIVITLRDNPQISELVHDFDLQQTVHELLSVKAKAIAIKGAGDEAIRMTGYTPIRCVGPAIYVNFQPIVAPYEIMALGNATKLKNALEMPDGIKDRARKAGLGIHIRAVKNLKLPAAEKTH